MSADLLAFADRWRLSLTSDLTQYAIFAIGFWLIVWVLLGSVLASRKIRPETPPARQLAIEFMVSLRSLAIFSTIGALLFMADRAGYLPGTALAASWGWGWAIASFVLMVIGHDAYFYWTHRLVHDPRLFRTFHRRHHKSHNPSPFTAYSFDVAEAAMQALFVPIWMVLVPTEWAVVGFFMLHQIVRNTMGHSGYELFPANADGKPLLGFLTTVTHHDLHHAEARCNYGLYFTWWDRLMGTEHPDYYGRFASATRRVCGVRKPVRANVAAFLIAAALGAGAMMQDAHAQSATRVHDDWATRGLGGVVRLTPCTGNASHLCGRLIWLWDASEVAPDALGSLILRDFVLENGEWRAGTVRNPEDGRTYSGSIRLEGDVLRLRGCAGPFCQTQVWRRLSSIPRP
jgi:sterol desaturase/sphingolipid hydroxylase (fatty acid hydroxylase superfamily)